ncbi:MAG: sensor histidine kinase [Rhodocyclales bacterium]|nr:sensor histidine kinase [Rhodocyclales bacterium]
MSLAHAAEDVAVASTRQLTLSAMVLIAITLAATMAFALWSWQRRQGLAARRRQAELALRASEGRLRQISSQLPVALFEYVAAPAPAFRSMSDGVARLLPGTAAAMLADSEAFFAGIHPDDRAGLVWRNPTTAAAREFEWVGRSLPAVDTPRWLQIRATTEITPEGERAVHGVILDVTALKEAQQDLERSRAELRRLASHREARVEQERARLAREFHDELGQVLTSARMQLQLLERALPAEAATAREAAHNIGSMIGEAHLSVKTIASDLRPAALNLGLTAAVEWVAARVLGPAGIRYHISFTQAADRLDGDYPIALFRIVQESLSNIVRHAAAHDVHITLSQDGEGMYLLVEDDGRGFDAAAVDHATHFGLLGMSERVTSLGGTLEIDSRPGDGTRLTVTLPLAPPDAPPSKEAVASP